MYIHTHPVEKCMIDKPQETMKMMAEMRAEAEKAKIKITGTVRRMNIQFMRS